MADPQTPLTPRSPLADLLRSGDHGNVGDDGPGLTIGARRDLAIVTVTARPRQAEPATETAFNGLGVALPQPGRLAIGDTLQIAWTGLDRWTAVATGTSGAALTRRLAESLGDRVALADQSHGLTVLRIEGPAVRDVLMKGVPVDVDPQVFGVGDTASTVMNHVDIQLWRTGLDEYHIVVMRSLARDLVAFMIAMGAEYGVRMAAG